MVLLRISNVYVHIEMYSMPKNHPVTRRSHVISLQVISYQVKDLKKCSV